MARLARFNEPDIPQHVIQRGNNRQVCFFDSADYPVYLDKLKLYANKYKVDIHAYVLMTNHVHLLATPRETNSLSLMMQSLGRYYVRYINQTYQRTGTLWEGRFKSTIIDSDRYYFQVSRYIELNPVRANMVTDPALYPWSSYQENALDKIIQLITPHPLYIELGATPDIRKQVYRGLFKEQLEQTIIDASRRK